MQRGCRLLGSPTVCPALLCAQSLQAAVYSLMLHANKDMMALTAFFYDLELLAHFYLSSAEIGGLPLTYAGLEMEHMPHAC